MISLTPGELPSNKARTERVSVRQEKRKGPSQTIIMTMLRAEKKTDT